MKPLSNGTSSDTLKFGISGKTNLLVYPNNPGVMIFDNAALKEIKELSRFKISVFPVPVEESPATETMLVREVNRGDLEKVIFRGLKRILSLKLPGPEITNLPAPKKIPHGELRHVQNQLLAIFDGTPQEIGSAHAALLERQFRLTVDSTLYLVGLVNTVEHGKWFLDELEEAWKRLSPNIPKRYMDEMEAMAC